MFNFQLWSKKKFWGVIIGVFLLGAVLPFGSSAQPAEPVETPVVHDARLEHLDQLDQELLQLAAEVIDAQSTAVEVYNELIGAYPHIGVRDVERTIGEIEAQTARIERVNTQIVQKRHQREALLAD